MSHVATVCHGPLNRDLPGDPPPNPPHTNTQTQTPPSSSSSQLYLLLPHTDADMFTHTHRCLWTRGTPQLPFLPPCLPLGPRQSHQQGWMQHFPSATDSPCGSRGGGHGTGLDGQASGTSRSATEAWQERPQCPHFYFGVWGGGNQAKTKKE